MSKQDPRPSRRIGLTLLTLALLAMFATIIFMDHTWIKGNYQAVGWMSMIAGCIGAAFMAENKGQRKLIAGLILLFSSWAASHYSVTSCSLSDEAPATFRVVKPGPPLK